MTFFLVYIGLAHYDHLALLSPFPMPVLSDYTIVRTSSPCQPQLARQVAPHFCLVHFVEIVLGPQSCRHDVKDPI